MNTRTLAIVLGVALAASVAVNLFAATAAYTALAGRAPIESRLEGKDRDDRRASPRELVAALSPDVRVRVRQSLRDAGLAARPDFQQAREARRQAIAAAAAEPFDAALVERLLDQSRDAEIRGRRRLEADTLAIISTLEPADRAAFAQILGRGKGGGNGRGAKAGNQRAK
ncbi:periplasmic heavy metal sensor [Brevundimonas sp.]|uniref:periplasmic heavy metal sensor n=1 Tax=Brevundimonas sp. TaxID=1871086 RepID=UPI00286D5D17|nr:periplasmic heavy metal sensor [Brevundimonas sp.]